MSTTVNNINPAAAPFIRPHERTHTALGMWLFITTEAALFVLMFFAWFYLASNNHRWPLHELPEYTKALIMAGILIASSICAEIGKKGMARGSNGTLQLLLGITLALAVVFLYMSWLDYSARLEKLTPHANAYGSISYTIISLHLAHLLLGMLMLIFVLARSFAGHFTEYRHVAVRNSVLYWHFVDVVWLFVVVIVYLSPHWFGATP